MNIADITSSRAKLARAYEHFHALESEIQEFGTQEEAKSADLTYRRDGAWHVVYLNPVPRLPMHTALVAGDCLNNIRAALDHLVWQLVLREGKEPDQANSFPIITNPDQFKKRCIQPALRNRKDFPLHGIPFKRDAWTIIQKAQPFNSAEPEEDELTMVNRLTRIDKHRTFLVQLAFTNRKVFASLIRWNSGVQPVEEQFSTQPMSSEQPTEIARFRFAPGVEIDISAAMKVDGDLPLRPCVGDGKIYIRMAQLDLVIRRVSKILDEIAALPGVQETTLQTKLFTT